ncbi:hypothetical protein [Pararhodonellum marinum]|uniref:hypothetical protein n=1 Tax=Pararhodonellum marinum TaxID=2755358 RepID=UPI001E3B4CD5|nr:hypothetical protein [Pararhodonellum marinum]
MEKVTLNVNFLDIEARKAKGHVFNGVILENTFRLSLFIDKADSFLPLIKGSIEASEMGSILFIEYRLFPSSIFFLAFWSLVTLLMAAFFGLTAGQPLYAFISFLVGLGNYFFAWSHFRRKTRRSQLIFHELLETEIKD